VPRPSRSSLDAAGPPRRGRLDLAFFASAALVTAYNELASGPVGVASKLLPMGLLMASLVLARRAGEVDRDMSGRILAGFVASTIGDVVITVHFVAGIAAFLVAHLAYLAGMGRPRGPVSRHALAAIPALCVGGGMAWILVGGQRVPGPLLIPVVVYMIVISSMLARATGRALVDVRTRRARVFLAGAAIFVLSDALIAFSRWVVALPHPRVAILATYYVAQWLLLQGTEAQREDSRAL
jgi:uncharacterized membrane protein YhhN